MQQVQRPLILRGHSDGLSSERTCALTCSGKVTSLAPWPQPLPARLARVAAASLQHLWLFAALPDSFGIRELLEVNSWEQSILILQNYCTTGYSLQIELVLRKFPVFKRKGCSGYSNSDKLLWIMGSTKFPLKQWTYPQSVLLAAAAVSAVRSRSQTCAVRWLCPVEAHCFALAWNTTKLPKIIVNREIPPTQLKRLEIL